MFDTILANDIGILAKMFKTYVQKLLQFSFREIKSEKFYAKSTIFQLLGIVHCLILVSFSKEVEHFLPYFAQILFE